MSGPDTGCAVPRLAALALLGLSEQATAGDVVAAGYVWKGNLATFGVARFTSSGRADSTFGVGGEVTTTFKPGHSAETSDVYALAIQTDGKIVAAGQAIGTTAAFALARYNVDGTLDPAFGSKGEVTTDIPAGPTSSNDYARAMSIQSDGKIVVAGTTVPSTGTAVNVGLVRYNSNGTLDTTFGTGGTVLTSHAAIPGSLVDPTFGRTWVGNAVVQPDGKILVAGYTLVTAIPSSYEAFVLRYNSNGTLDSSFGNSGAVVLPPQHVSTPNGTAGAVAVEPNGEIAVSGLNQLALLHADGTLDPAFGNGGIAPGGTGSVAIEPNGEIVIAGNLQGSGQVSRFHSDGSPDLTFGAGGTVVPFPGPNAGYLVTAFALQPDGKIDVASGFDLARLLSSEPQIGSFMANQPTPGGSLTLTASNITDGNPGSNVIQVSFYYFDARGIKVALGSGTPAAGAWMLTTNMTPGTYALFAQAEDSDGVFGDPAALSLNIL
jgi:uncharacterized delta-60 repeat protein